MTDRMGSVIVRFLALYLADAPPAIVAEAFELLRLLDSQ